MAYTYSLSYSTLGLTLTSPFALFLVPAHGLYSIWTDPHLSYWCPEQAVFFPETYFIFYFSILMFLCINYAKFLPLLRSLALAFILFSPSSHIVNQITYIFVFPFSFLFWLWLPGFFLFCFQFLNLKFLIFFLFLKMPSILKT